MKKLTLLSVTCLVILFACTKKVAPVISSRTEFPEAPKTTKSATTATSSEMVAAGKTLYSGKCARCHDPKDPTEYTAPRWESILKSMAPKQN